MITALLSLPPTIRRILFAVLAAALIVAGFLLWLSAHDRSVREAERERIAAEAREKAERADRASAGAVEASRKASDERTAAARKAAAESDDPLKAGLEGLRK